MNIKVVNVSIFDSNYIESLFGGMIYPDGTFVIDCVDELITHQKIFMEVVSEIRSENMFTFPVLTYSLLKRRDISEKEAKKMIKSKNFDVFVDGDFARWCSDHNTKWNDSNFFISDDVTTLSNCPLSGDTEILYWSEHYQEYKMSPIKELYHNCKNKGIETIKVISNGNEIECKINRFEEVPLYKITLANGSIIQTTRNHLNKVLDRSYVKTENLTTEDYLPMSMTCFEKTKNMSYEDGKLVGMFLGDGSFRNDTEITFSLNIDTDADDIDFINDYCVSKFGAKITQNVLTSQISGNKKCVNVNVNSSYIRGLINQFVDGDNALNKSLNLKAISCSLDFRRGILDGLYTTDGGNSNRIYTSSIKLKNSLISMLSSMGIPYNLREDNRENRLGSNPNYTITWYSPDGKLQRKNVYKIQDGYMWVKISSIEKINTANTVSYCLEVVDGSEPVFMLANGVYTHNCRLLSDTSKLSGFINSIGGTALSIGSVKVNTINLMRIALESKYDEDVYLEKLKDTTLLCCKTLEIIRHIIKRNVEKGLLPNYQEGAVEMSKQYCTIGILGLFEVIESFGYTKKDEFGYISYTDEGLDFAGKIFAVLNDVKDNFTNDFSFNIESVPAERAAVILCQKDNLLFGLNEKFIYSNQWIPLSEKCTIQEKLRLSSILDVKCSGGSISHINLESNFPNTDSAWNVLNRIALSNVIYFAFNTRINECKNHHGFVGSEICPVCGEPVFDTYQRIVGYLVPTRSYSKDRFKEFNTRQWYDYAQMMREQ